MWNIVANNYLEYGVKVFVADATEDVEKIPISACKQGSTVFVIDGSKTYMLTGDKEWKAVSGSAISGIINSTGGSGSSSGGSSSGSSGSSSPDPTEYDIMDGGSAAG